MRQRHHPEPGMARQADPETTPGPLAAWTQAAVSAGLAPFAGCFIRPTWTNMLVLVAGAILSPGRRTVASALSSVGLRGAAVFNNYHRVLNRSRWQGQAAVPGRMPWHDRAHQPENTCRGPGRRGGQVAEARLDRIRPPQLVS